MTQVRERKFLHDIASPLGTAIFQADSLLESMQTRPGANADELMLARQVYEALEKIKNMIHEHREFLIKSGVPSARV